ncbi:MAG: BACON domain-containing protein [Dysgonamonadaceae bacterium]|nr:BACON domain-containing protein [Dysgonamonadaceae bacterium]MDD4728100.1 BACON domain-containing protein [Dysgonamonadaceae bacterium]
MVFSCGDSDESIPAANGPTITLKETNADFSTAGGSQSISFESNMSWTAKSSHNWCTVSPTSGDASAKSITISVTPNDTYNNRSCIVTFRVEGITKSVTVVQSQEDAIILPDKTHTLSSDSHQLAIRLDTNVDFDVIIPDDAKNWVSYTGTRALRTEILLLNIEENKGFVERTTEVYVKNTTTGLIDTLTIAQLEKYAFFVKEMGTLAKILNQTQKDTITSMIVRGEINEADFKVMREQMPKLKYLDLVDVKGIKFPVLRLLVINELTQLFFLRVLQLLKSLHFVNAGA